MFHSHSSRLRLASSLLAAGLLVSSAASVSAQSATTTAAASCSAPILDLANPTPGDMLLPGGYIIQGTAFDPESQQGTGIDGVSVFLDSRDAGGMELGQAVPGAVASSGMPALGAHAFALAVTLPDSNLGGHSIVAYAHSSLSGQETVVSVPIVLGEDPSQAGAVPGSATESNSNPGMAPANCMPSATAPATTPIAVSNTTPSTTAPTSVSTAAAGMPHMAPMTLQVANPQPGDTVLSGAYVISGVAHDPNAQNGTGIARVSIFLDDRDDGGLELAQLTPTSSDWSVTVTLPASALGMHSLFVYADSAVSNAEATLSVPFTLAQ